MEDTVSAWSDGDLLLECRRSPRTSAHMLTELLHRAASDNNNFRNDYLYRPIAEHGLGNHTPGQEA